MTAYMLRQQIAQLVDEWTNQQKIRSLRELADLSKVKSTAVRNMHLEHSASLESICKVLEVLGYELVIQKKEW
ncbi:MAG: hypothetical protein IJJ69_09075 [Oscillospiraceae bacterium]|jgi:hypothetical protein|nr:hypothetical protein [Oscillospiraceae bacterium]